ncbi:MAG: glycosyltransferase family 9 protein [Candidatus Woesearchaeota archaeon]
MSIKIQRAIDKSLGVACFGLGAVSKIFPKFSLKTDKILIIKLWAMGESILTLPMIKELRKAYPSAKISVLCRERNKDVYTLNPDIDEIILFEPKNIFGLIKLFKRFDLVIDCEPYLKTSALASFYLGKRRIGFSHGARAWMYTDKIDYNDQQHVVDTYLDFLKLLGMQKKADALVKLCYSSEDKAKVMEMLAPVLKQKKQLIGFCAGAAESTRERMWPKEKFAELADRLIKDYDAQVIFIGSKKESELEDSVIQKMKNKHNTVNLAGRTSVKELFALIEMCDLFISNDTGPMHIAAAQGVRTIGLFGPNTPVRFAPYGKGNIFIYHKIDCSPCINVHKGKVPDCNNKIKGECMQKISVDEVLAAVKKCLKK